MRWDVATTGQIAVNFKNAAREASARLARNAVLKNIKKSPPQAFKAAWERLLSNPSYRLLIRISQDPAKEWTQLNGRTFELLSLEIPDFYHSTQIVVSANLKDAIDSKKSFLIVQIHQAPRFVSKVLADLDRESTRIVGNPKRYAQRLQKLGIDTSRTRLIKKGVSSLAHLLKSVRSNHVICSVIDDGDGDGTGRRKYINPAIFVFAHRARIPVFFAKAHVDHTGVCELISSGPYNDLDPITYATKFLNFFNSVGDSRVDMKIRTRHECFDWKEKTAQI